MLKKLYLGDGVYGEDDGFHVVLTTRDGIKETNRICLDPHVIAALFLYIDRIKEERGQND